VAMPSPERGSHRLMPPLDAQAMRAASKPVVTNDEVAAILKGLQLDKAFFLGKLHSGLLEELKPADPSQAHVLEPPEMDQRLERRRSSLEMMSPEALRKRIEKDRLKASLTAGRSRNSVVAEQDRKIVDFDIYLNQVLLPVLAQSLDSLCRQLNRMEEKGDAFDPKARARFNPLTWLAQQLQRRHPRCARTPRRQALYQKFGEWSDQEHGRREMLRMKDTIHQVFNGFVLRNSVQKAFLPKVVNAIDDTLKLGSVLKSNPHVQRALGVVAPPDRNAMRMSIRSPGGETWSFARFWHTFANLLLEHDIVPYSAIEKGAKLQEQEVQERLEREEAQQKMEERRQQKEEDQRRLVQEYTGLRERLIADPQIQAMLEEGKLLTGDDMRPGDVGYENEVPPKGPHVALLTELLSTMGFERQVQRMSTPSEPHDQELEEEEWYWTDDLAKDWSLLQEVCGDRLTDGVVEKGTLEKVLVQPDGFLLLKSRVEDELERVAEGDEGEGTSNSMTSARPASDKTRPSMESMCQKYGMTMSRMTWLHELFESFVVPEPDAPKDAPRCGYPENAKSIHKPQMRELVYMVNSTLTDAEFEARFRRIDQDSDGEIEFDEFVDWVYNDDIQVVGAGSKKMSLEDLAAAYGEPLALMKHLLKCFRDRLQEDQEDNYPEVPAGLAKDSVKELLEALTLNRVDGRDFEADWQIVDANGRGVLDFDEFLEVLDLGELSEETRQMCE